MKSLRKAMERAKEEREAPEEMAPPPPPPQSELRGLSLDLDADAGEDEVHPSYTRTRVDRVDPEVFRRSKILSAFHMGAVTNQVKLLRTQVLQRLQELGGSTVLVTSPRTREGKSFTAMNLAVSIAHEVNRTALLVDADIQKPAIHAYFGLPASIGLADYLLGRAEVPDVLVNPGVPKLTILPAGTRQLNSSELLGSPRMAALVSEMKARYPERVIVFDGPGLLEWADPLVFARHVDAVLLVLEAERSRRTDLLRALDLLAGRPVLGIVYNKARD